MCVPPSTTKDGYEIQFGTNYLGHALLVSLLLPVLRKTSGGRVVTLSSSAFAYAPKPGIAFESLKAPGSSGMTGPMYTYCQSKLANHLYAKELARRYPDITSVAVHPGIVATPLISKLGWMDRMIVYATNPQRSITSEQGAYNMLWAATTPAQTLANGTYYVPVGEKGKESKYSQDKELGKNLYDWTEKELQPFLLQT